mgnify:CR=1 FL=1
MPARLPARLSCKTVAMPARLSARLKMHATSLYAGMQIKLVQRRVVAASRAMACSQLTITTVTTLHASEMSWQIDGGTYSSATFSNYGTYTASACLTDGTHFLRMFDTYGDGWTAGSTVGIVSEDGLSLIEPIALGSGFEASIPFYVGALPSTPPPPSPPPPSPSPPPPLPPPPSPPPPLPSSPLTSSPEGCVPNPEAMCIMVYAPVCGVDGVTYSNSCQAAAACQLAPTDGECGASASTASSPPALSDSPSPPPPSPVLGNTQSNIESSSSGDDGLADWAVAVIVLAALAFVAAVAGGVLVSLKSKRTMTLAVPLAAAPATSTTNDAAPAAEMQTVSMIKTEEKV